MINLTFKEFNEAVKNGLKVLHLDTETSPSQFYGFSCGKTVLSHKQIKRGTETRIISVQYKWEGERKCNYLVWERTRNGFSDSKMLDRFNKEVLSKADIIVGQNIDSFDMKVLNDRLCKEHLTPLFSKPSIDILKLSRKAFRMMSHRLDARSKSHGFGGKISMELQDWIDIVEGIKKPEDKMIPYGLKDVYDAENIFHEEFDYYIRLPVHVEKLVRSYLPKPATIAKPLKVECPKCAVLKKGSKFNTSKTSKSTYTCNVCETIIKVNLCPTLKLKPAKS